MTGATAAALIVSTVVLCTTAVIIVVMLRPSRGAERRPTSDSWEVAVRGLETRLKALETEWEDFYARALKRLNRIGGEKRQQLDEPRSTAVDSEPMTRADLLRRARAKRGGSDV